MPSVRCQVVYSIKVFQNLHQISESWLHTFVCLSHIVPKRPGRHLFYAMKKIIVAALLFVLCVSAYGQHYNVIAGFSPYASYTLKRTIDDKTTYSFRYAPYYGGNIAFELPLFSHGMPIFSNFNVEGEFHYSKGKLKEYPIESVDSFPSDYQKDMTDWSLNILGGPTINNAHRFSIPIRFGVGYTSINSGLGKVHGYQFLLKANARFFISNRFAIYAGGRYELGIKTKNALIAEGGIVFSLNDN